MKSCFLGQKSLQIIQITFKPPRMNSVVYNQRIQAELMHHLGSMLSLLPTFMLFLLLEIIFMIEIVYKEKK